MPRFYFSSQRSQDVSGWLARPMWLAEAAAIGLVVAVTPSLRARLEAWVKRLWEGDVERHKRKARMLYKCHYDPTH